MEAAARFRSSRVLIAGGLGFIGSTLAGALAEAGADVVIVDVLSSACGGNYANIAAFADAVQVVEADLRERDRMAELVRGCEVVFNLAGHTSHIDSMAAPEVDLALNCESALGLLEACRRASPAPAVVFAGTRQIYGRPRYLPVDEAHPVAPVDVNGIHKAAVEQYHLLYGRRYGIPVSVLRLTNTYGPRMYVRDARQTFLGLWLKAVVRGEEFEVWGDGSQLRDFTYVDDAVAALLSVAGEPRVDGRSLNLGGERTVTLLELAELAVSANGGGAYRVVPFPEERLAIDIGDYVGDYGAIRELLGWEPRVPLEEGLPRTLAYLEQHGAHYW